MTVTLVFETHSTTTDNERGIATGWLPGELSEAGIKNAKELGRRRREDGNSKVFTSDLRRAVQTAEIAFAGSKMSIVHDPRLRECNYGDLNGRPRAEREGLTQYVQKPFPNGESYLDVVERTRSFLADLMADHHDERVLVHSANRWSLDHLVNGEDVAEAMTRPFVWQPGWEYVIEPSSRLTEPWADTR